MKYDLVVIRDEASPLTSGIQNNYSGLYVSVLTVLILAAIVASVICYVCICKKYRSRLDELQKESGGTGYRGWNLKKLKEEQSFAENQVVSHKFD